MIAFTLLAAPAWVLPLGLVATSGLAALLVFLAAICVCHVKGQGADLGPFSGKRRAWPERRRDARRITRSA